MPWTSEHVEWFIHTGKKLETADGKEVEVWEFRHQCDESVLSEWATHFRNHYCLDSQIDYFRKGYKCSRAEYLNSIKFPDPEATPGPSIRAGDFGEVLVADFLQYLLGYWVPRTRYGDKTTRNESTKGTDIIGFHFLSGGGPSPEDTLAVFEAKTQFSGKKPKSRLQDAIEGSAKDSTRIAESLNAIKQRLVGLGELANAERIERFQNKVDHPYEEIQGAAALFEDRLFDDELVSSTTTADHPNAENLSLLVIRGNEMMRLVHDLYRRAANEA